ncbi:indolepyruvate ferredoxin oxidoreductase subunit alpha [Candidatus Heimdallarchaeota archaeon B3_Heim]|nr:MAG: indolepyruvate ferredoxin oxidoreductase subunit alpha [Candidatus Heimdallarchaeota archaeon B3_Heim]
MLAKLKDIFQDVKEVGKKNLVLLGNEAIARGIVELGVAGVFTYPGTPSSEIPTTLFRAKDVLKQKGYDLYLEWSTNEAVALESAYGFSFSGLRTVFICKHVGLNVAADVFLTLVNAGVLGGLVMIVAEDPEMHSSQNEQDNRWYTKLANIPMFEPSDAREAKEMLKSAFEVSEKFETPVILRTVTRIAHSRADIPLNPITNPNIPEDMKLKIDPSRFVCVPGNARQNKLRILERVERISKYMVGSNWNRIEQGKKQEHAIITSGSAYAYTREVINHLELDFPVLKIGVSHPFPKKIVGDFLKVYSSSTILIIEEADSVLETFVKKLSFEENFLGKIIGRAEGITPPHGELTTRKLLKGLSRVLNQEVSIPSIPSIEGDLLFSRPPVLCPGCPHRATFYALNKSVPKRHRIVSTDIGCYTLGASPPLNAGHLVICMGSSLGIGSGISQIPNQKEPIVAIIGDSTFWHTGLPGLVNAVYNNSKLLLLVVDNAATAMTGFQPNPGEKLSIAEAAKGVGVNLVTEVDAFDPKSSLEVMKEAVKFDGVSVIVSKGECRIQFVRREGLPDITYLVESSRCVGCHTCINRIACPAIMWSDQKNDKGKVIPIIDQFLCARCGLCSEVCPYGVIVPKSVKEVLGE